jgi:hypothetical protein
MERLRAVALPVAQITRVPTKPHKLLFPVTTPPHANGRGIEKFSVRLAAIKLLKEPKNFPPEDSYVSPRAMLVAHVNLAENEVSEADGLETLIRRLQSPM